MAKSMTANEIIQVIEKLFGRQPEKYMLRLINDALLDIADKKQHYTVSSIQDLLSNDRWYTLSDNIIDIIRVEILDTNDRYVMIPKLTDSHLLLREDTDIDDDSLK
tara:strand:- start:164 stop:481 length:318 start_codon:yes stop_codon:yes gene_type:complete